jgi:hypothetical protein
MLKPAICKRLQAVVPTGSMTSTSELHSTTNPKIIWWAWCPDAPAPEIEELLAQQTASTPHAADGMDWSVPLKLGPPGQQVRDEIEGAQRLRSGVCVRACASARDEIECAQRLRSGVCVRACASASVCV